MTGADRGSRPARTGPLLLAVPAGALHLVVGYFYLASGLAIPGYAWLPLLLVWLVLAAWLLRLALQRSWWTPVVPMAAAGVLVLTGALGGALLGWTA